MSATIQSVFGKPLSRGEPHLAYEGRASFATAHSWSADEDAILCDAIADGYTFRIAAARLPGRSRNSCIGRMHRIVAKMESAA